jgi:hypothetical protein
MATSKWALKKEENKSVNWIRVFQDITQWCTIVNIMGFQIPQWDFRFHILSSQHNISGCTGGLITEQPSSVLSATTTTFISLKLGIFCSGRGNDYNGELQHVKLIMPPYCLHIVRHVKLF